MSGKVSKTKSKTGKVNVFHILLLFFLCMTVALVVTLTMKQKIVDKETEGVTQLDLINSTLQRVTKLELEDNRDDALVAELDELMLKVIDPHGNSEYFTEKHGHFDLLKQYEMEYLHFMQAIVEYRNNKNRDNLFEASEHHYVIALDISTELSEHVVDLTDEIATFNAFLIFNMVLVALLLIKIARSTHLELEKNKKLSDEMYIDVSTGIYNRAKCQEILKTQPMQPEEAGNRAIIIFDLNDLKKTNDNLGHRAGDDLIASFAAQLKVATKISTEEIFVGRYGGDEFMAYLNGVEEDDVILYLKEVDFVIDHFNRTQNKPFQLSCAAGYGITTADTKATKTMRELFDEADGQMYENKIAMKKRKKEELEKQGVVDDFVDTRI